VKIEAAVVAEHEIAVGPLVPILEARTANEKAGQIVEQRLRLCVGHAVDAG
jgi:hypothetical protein